jgi:hypothetical protein
MSIFLLGAAPSLRAGAHADYGKPIPDSERRLPSAIAGADIPNDTVLQIKKRSPSMLPVNSTLVYGNPATELPLLVERFSVARGDTVRRARLDRHAAETANNARRSHQVMDWTWLATALVRRISRNWYLVDVVSTSHDAACHRRRGDRIELLSAARWR